MAKTILEALQQSTQTGAPNQQLGSMTDETQRAQTLLSAKSGKAGSSSAAPRQSSIAETLAANQGDVASQQLGQQANLQAQQLSQQQEQNKQQLNQGMSQLNEKDLDAQDNYTRQATSILNDLARKGDELDFKKDKAKLEQAGFNMRLSNDQYVKNLKREGEKARLTNANNMKEAIANSVFSNEQDLMKDDITFRNLMKAKDRSYQDDLANINLDFALKMSQASNEGANQRALWSGIGQTVSGGAQAAAAVGTKSPTSTTVTNASTAPAQAPSNLGLSNESNPSSRFTLGAK